ESYPNRDSLKYKELYGLHDAETILRGTLRRPGFCAAWHAFVQLGLTDDSYEVRNLENMTYADFVRAYLPYSEDDLITNFSRYIGTDITSETMERIAWLGLLDEEPIGLTKASPADVLQKLLENKWKAESDDEDMIAMQHLIEYQQGGEKYQTKSSLVVTGKVAGLSGMAKTVGYPMGIAAKLILEDKIAQRGLLIPVHREVYEPILRELIPLGISFVEATDALSPLAQTR
ncbi:MAG: saccharopine dehydrogenase C-terminal domain-containing protein, partial [Cyclobacteriaceae bacterium]